MCQVVMRADAPEFVPPPGGLWSRSTHNVPSAQPTQVLQQAPASPARSENEPGPLLSPLSMPKCWADDSDTDEGEGGDNVDRETTSSHATSTATTPAARTSPRRRVKGTPAACATSSPTHSRSCGALATAAAPAPAPGSRGKRRSARKIEALKGGAPQGPQGACRGADTVEGSWRKPVAPPSPQPAKHSVGAGPGAGAGEAKASGQRRAKPAAGAAVKAQPAKQAPQAPPAASPGKAKGGKAKPAGEKVVHANIWQALVEEGC